MSLPGVVTKILAATLPLPADGGEPPEGRAPANDHHLLDVGCGDQEDLHDSGHDRGEGAEAMAEHEDVGVALEERIPFRVALAGAVVLVAGVGLHERECEHDGLHDERNAQRLRQRGEDETDPDDVVGAVVGDARGDGLAPAPHRESEEVEGRPDEGRRGGQGKERHGSPGVVFLRECS